MFSLGCIVFALFALSTNAQSSCKTPIGEDGQCVPVSQCSIILNILQYTPKPLPEKALDYLRKSHCRSEDKRHFACCSPRHFVNAGTQPSPAPPTPTPQPAQPDPVPTPGDNNFPDVSNHPNLRLLPINRCGRIDGDRVSNGNKTSFLEFPWMVLLRYQTSQGLRFQCGGTLINSKYILTAAHCVTGISDTLVSVRIGEYDTSKERDCELFGDEEDCADPVQDIDVDTVTFHPQYNRPRFANDVAVIRLAQEAVINDHSVQSICLPYTTAAQTMDLKRVTISGWGLTEQHSVQPICLPFTPDSQNVNLERVTISGWGLTEKQQLSEILLKAIVPILSNDECQRVYKRSVTLTNAQICAGGETGIDSCEGDSGGPLFFPGPVQGLRYVQYGVISAGANSCGGDHNFPGIYVRVAYYLQWILDQLQD